MRVTDLPPLLPREYARANYLRNEIAQAVNYAKRNPNKRQLIVDFLEAAGDAASIELGDLEPTGGEEDA